LIPDESKAFHRKIERLIRTSGFQILESDFYKSGPNIVARVEGQRLLVQCKRAPKRVTYLGLTGLVKRYSRKVRETRASVGILALSNYSLPKGMQSQAERARIVKQYKISIWDDHSVEYFSLTARALGQFARFSMMKELGIDKKFAPHLRIPATVINEKGRKFAYFTMRPHDMIRRAFVFRREVSAAGYQRMLSKRRLDDIAEFVKNGGSFPTNIVCAFGPGAKYSERRGEIVIPSMYGSIWIIDGQHRLFSFTRMPDSFQFDIPCAGFNATGLSKLSLAQQADIFVKINQEAVRIPSMLLLDLYGTVGIKHRGVEIVKELSEKSPFAGLIQLVGTGHRPISLPTFALTPAMTRLVEEGGVIGQWYKEKSASKFQAVCTAIIKKYFDTLSRIISKEWRSPSRYVVATNRGIRAFLRLLPYVMEYSNGLRNEGRIRECLRPLRKFNFRESDLKRKYLGEGGADEFAEDMIRLVKGSCPNFGPKQVVTLEEVIRPGEREKAEHILESTFRKFHGEVIGQLKFVDKSTYTYLATIPSECGIRLMVDGSKQISQIRTLVQGRPYVQVKKIARPDPSAQGKERGFIHERWISDSEQQVEVGTDLKSESLGNNQHTIRITKPAKFTPAHLSFEEMWDMPDTELESRYGEGTHAKMIINE